MIGNISDLGPFGAKKFLFSNLKDFSSLGVDKDINAALASIGAFKLGEAAGPVLAEVLGPVVEAVIKDPKQAAEIARKASQIGAAVVRASSEREDTGVSVDTKTSTTKETKRDGNKIIVTTTETRTRTQTTDLDKQAEYNRKVADQLEKLGAGLPDGKIQIGNETVTVEQLKDLANSVFALLGSKGESEPINITPEEQKVPKAEDKAVPENKIPTNNK